MTPEKLCNQFLGWQCRIRQIAMREDEGRPSAGMRPGIVDGAGKIVSDGIVTLITRKSPQESTEFFKFQVQKHNDPQDTYKKGLTFLQSTHYHRADEFCDELSALFPPFSELAKSLMNSNGCILTFEQFSQKYTLPCQVRQLESDVPIYQATLWHNRLFNRSLSNDVIILGFKPDWENAKGP